MDSLHRVRSRIEVLFRAYDVHFFAIGDYLAQEGHVLKAEDG